MAAGHWFGPCLQGFTSVERGDDYRPTRTLIVDRYVYMRTHRISKSLTDNGLA